MLCCVLLVQGVVKRWKSRIKPILQGLKNFSMLFVIFIKKFVKRFVMRETLSDAFTS